jgi:hypothetical protein
MMSNEMATMRKMPAMVKRTMPSVQVSLFSSLQEDDKIIK